MLDQALGSLHHQLRAHLHQSVVHIPGRIITADTHILAEDDAAGIDILIYHERGDAGNTLAVYHRPVDRSGAAVLRQKSGVQVERAELRHAPDFLRQHAERHHHEEIRLPFGQRRKEFRILQLDWLQHRQPVLHGISLDRALVHFQSAPARLVGHRDHADNFISGLHQRIQRSHCKLGRSHEHNAFRAENPGHLALELAPVVQQRIVTEEGGILDGPRGQVCPDRAQYQGRDERAQRGADRSIPGQFGAGDIHHPIKHEEQHGYDGAHPERALADECAQRGPDEEQQQARKRLSELLEQLDIGAAEVEIVFIDLAAIANQAALHALSGIRSFLIGSFLVPDMLPPEIIRILEVIFVFLPCGKFGSIQLISENEAAILCKG